MKGISTRRQVIIAAHSVFRGQIERWYDTWGRHGAVSSPLPVDLPARRSSPGDGIVPWPLLFLLGVFALLTVLQQLWRDYGVGHQTKGLREETVRKSLIDRL